MSATFTNLEIPKKIYDKLKPCWKCGQKPILIEDAESCEGVLYKWWKLECPNEKCNNFYYFEGEDNKTRTKFKKSNIDRWNKKNIEKYIPKSELKESEQNCRHCKHVKQCVNTREEHIGQFFDAHICGDFKLKT